MQIAPLTTILYLPLKIKKLQEEFSSPCKRVHEISRYQTEFFNSRIQELKIRIETVLFKKNHDFIFHSILLDSDS
jgi:hypothetical protein